MADDSSHYTALDRWSYGASITEFLLENERSILGRLVAAAEFPVDLGQRDAWQGQIALLRNVLDGFGERGAVYFEYAIPRLGKRIDTVLILDHVLFVLEFKVGKDKFTLADRDQVWDYALDLKNFHEPSHQLPIVPMLIATKSNLVPLEANISRHQDGLLAPLYSGAAGLRSALELGLRCSPGAKIDYPRWQQGRYQPTPTIVEAAMALYAGHAVEESRAAMPVLRILR